MQEALDLMIEITLPDPDHFLKIKETLTRIGVSSSTEGTKRLYPSVVILHKKGKYYLTHFKCMFLLDGKSANLSAADIVRFRTIAKLIKDWGLCSFNKNEDIMNCDSSFNPKLIKIVPFREKGNWEIVAKYSVGTKEI
jgi:hypothetical protein